MAIGSSGIEASPVPSLAHTGVNLSAIKAICVQVVNHLARPFTGLAAGDYQEFA